MSQCFRRGGVLVKKNDLSWVDGRDVHYMRMSPIWPVFIVRAKVNLVLIFPNWPKGLGAHLFAT